MDELNNWLYTDLYSLDDSFLDTLKTIDGKIDLTIGIVCIIIAYILSKYVIRRFIDNKYNTNIDFKGKTKLSYYLLSRSLFPITAIILCLINYIRFLLMTDKVSVIYPALMWLLLWMWGIRIITAIVTFVIPRGPIKYTIGNLIALGLWGIFLLWWSGLLQQIITQLDAVSFHIGKFHFTLLSIISSLFFIFIIIIINLWANRLLARWLTTSRKIDNNFQQVILRISRFVILLIIILSSLPILGIDLTTLSIFSGALGVGIGIGLQKFVSNFISGIMLLADHSVKVGDRLVVGESVGYVTKITSRHVILQSLDHSEILVPNEKFMVDAIVNQSYTNNSIRLDFKVRVAYGTDVRLALDLLEHIADNIDGIDQTQKAITSIDKFSDFGIDLLLYLWVSEPRDSFWEIKKLIHLNILDAFAAHNIIIPYPRQDIMFEKHS